MANTYHLPELHDQLNDAGAPPGRRAAVTLVRDVLARLRPEQVRHNGNWHSAGGVTPPTPDTVGHVGYWFAVSPEGRARGLDVNSSGAPRLPDRYGSFSSLEIALGLTHELTEGIFSTDPATFKDGDGRILLQDNQHADPRRGLEFTLARVDLILGTARRVLSSR